MVHNCVEFGDSIIDEICEVVGLEPIPNYYEESKYILKGMYQINDTLINEGLFDDQLTDYRIIDVETEVHSLYQWISEARTKATRVLMITDLKQLEKTIDEYVLSSNSTNHYVESDDSEFNELCETILTENEENINIK